MGLILDGVGIISATGNVYALNVVANNVVPTGGIIMWSGSIAAIPTGWYLCNGSNGTADAVVVSHTHTATVTDPTHTHYSYGSGAFNGGGAGGAYGISGTGNPSYQLQPASTGITVSNSTNGVSGTNQNLPPYYALAYIMKS